MDPNAALDSIISAIVSGDFDAAQESLSDLREWRERGGFLPSDPRMRGVQVGFGNVQHNVF